MEVDSSGPDDKSSGKSDESEDEVRETAGVNQSRTVRKARGKLTMYGRIARGSAEYPTPRRT